jgi:protein-tyrosine phosphatase
MIDIHCHPLWDTDDGAKSFDISVKMCEMAAADGTTHLVATPHSNYKYELRPEQNRQKLAELQAAVGDKIKLLLGCDFHLSFDNIDRIRKERPLFTINGTRYLLVEFSDHFIPEHMDRVFYDVQIAGIVPILTHPERNPVFQRKPELLHHWVTRGCLGQVTAQSFTGDFGSAAEELSLEWFGRNLVHFLASDAHDTEYRPPVLSVAYKRAAELRGEEVADLLLNENPRAVIEDRPLPEQPPPLGALPKVKKRKGLFSFLKGNKEQP